MLLNLDIVCVSLCLSVCARLHLVFLQTSCVSQERHLWNKLTASRMSLRYPSPQDGAHLSSQLHLHPLQPKCPVLPHHKHRHSTVSSTCQMPPDSVPLLVPSLGLYLFSVPHDDPNLLTQNHLQSLKGLPSLLYLHLPNSRILLMCSSSETPSHSPSSTSHSAVGSRGHEAKKMLSPHWCAKELSLSSCLHWIVTTSVSCTLSPPSLPT